MADSKHVAERLQEFVKAAGQVPKPPPIQATKGGWPIQSPAAMNPPRSFRERTEVFEACIAKIDEPDRIELARILATMFDALRSL
jgi:hypothetical protein